MFYYFYVLRCSDGSLYIGTTSDIKKRLREHNHGNRGAKYTRGRRPVWLVYLEKIENKSEALKREAEVKKWAKARKEELVKQ